MKVKMQWIRKPAKRTFAVAVSLCILMQTLVTSFSTMAAGYVGGGMTASLDGNGNLILSGKYDGDPSDIKSIGAYELPIFQDENNTNYNNLKPIATLGAASNEFIGEFEGASLDGWIAGSGVNIKSTVASSQVFNADQSVILAPSGGHFLQATRSAADGKATVKKQFSSAINLAGCKYISFYFQADAGTATQNTVELTLAPTNGEMKTYSAQYTPSAAWTLVQFDISDLSGRDAIWEIAISYQGSFRIDSVCATADSRQLPATLDPSAKLKIADFSNGSLDDFVNTNTDGVDYVAAEGFMGNNHCLEITRQAQEAIIPCYTKRDFAAGSELDLGGYNMLSFYVNSWGIGQSPDEKFYIDLILTANDESVYQKKQQIEPGVWQILSYDISEFERRDSITSIQIGIFCQGFEHPWNGHFFIDDIYAHANIATVYDFEYAMANGWQGADCANTAHPGVTGPDSLYLAAETGRNIFASHGKYAHTQVRDDSPGTLPSTIQKTFVEPLDLSRYSLIAFDATAWVGAPTNQYSFHLMLESNGQTKEYSLPITADSENWRSFIFDISDCEFRDNLTAIKIGWSLNYTAGWTGLFYIDNIRFGGIGDFVIAEPVVPDLTYNFENADAQGWTLWDNNQAGYGFSTGGSGGVWGIPIQASEGEYCIVGVRDGAPVTTPSTLKREFETPMDLSQYTQVTFDATAATEGSLTNTYRFHLYLKSGDQVKEYSDTVIHDILEWHTLTFDISDCDFRDSITAIGLGLSLEGGTKDPSGTWWQPYYFDNIRFSKNSETDLTETKFDFENGDAQGWTVWEHSAPGGYGFSSNYHIEASEGEYCLIGCRGAATVDIPSTLIHNYSTPIDLSQYKQIIFDANASLGGSKTFTYRFHLYLQSGDQIKEYSDTVIHDTSEWHTLTFNISDCDFRDSITAIGLGLSLEGGTSDPSGEWWQLYYFDNIRFVLAGEEDSSTEQGGIDEQGNFEFVVPLDMIESLESKFVTVITDNNDQSRLLSPAQYISDFSSVSANVDPYPTVGSIKGIGHVLSTDNERLGSNNSGININLARFIPLAAPGDNTVTYIYKGKTYYFDKSAVKYYDDYIRVRSTNGEIMYGILILPIGSNSILVHPDADKLNDALSMVSLNDQAKVDLYSAIVSFIANRYNGSNPELGRICDYVVGNEIGSKYWNSMGNASFEEYVKEYERWLRLTNALVKQAWSNARVFASFDYWWAETQTYSQPELIKEIDRLSKAGGDYDWNIAWHPYPGNMLDSKSTWDDSKCTNNINTTPRISWKNLQLLPQFLKDNHIEFNGETRRIILSEQGFHSDDNSIENQKIQAAAFAYAYYKALSLPEIDYFCLRDGVDHSPETENGLQFGIWTMVEGEDSQPDKEKYIYNVVKYIDTVRSLEVTSFAFDVIPASFGTTWEELVGISEEEIRALCTLPVVETGTTAAVSSDKKQTTLSAGDKENWLDNDNTSDLTVVMDEALGADILSMNVFGDYYKEFKGATYTPAASLDMTNKVIIAKVKANGLSANQQMEYMIRAYSGDKVIEGSYVGLAGNWQTFSLDVSDFTGVTSIDRIKVWARPVNNTVWNNGSFEIAGLYTASADEVPGDIDCDGNVDSEDLILLRKILMETISTVAEADVNGDSAVDIRDLIALKKLTLQA